jgi:uncharacterized protein YjbJ (UPF0337 family)
MEKSPVAKPENSQEIRINVVKDLHARWGKFSEQELSALKGKDDLVSQLQTRYSLDKTQAAKDVDTVLNGRSF